MSFSQDFLEAFLEDGDGSHFMEVWRLEEHDFRSTWIATLSVQRFQIRNC